MKTTDGWWVPTVPTILSEFRKGHMSDRVDQLLGPWGWENLQPLMTGNPCNGARNKPLRTWVDEFIPYYILEL